MDRETEKWADDQVRRYLRQNPAAAETLTTLGFGQPWHNGRLHMFVTCQTCGAVVEVSNDVGKHWGFHHPLRVRLLGMASTPRALRVVERLVHLSSSRKGR